MLAMKMWLNMCLEIAYDKHTELNPKINWPVGLDFDFVGTSHM